MSTDTFASDGLVIRVTYRESTVSIECEGTSDARDPDSFLGPMLRRLVPSCKNKTVTVDLSTLSYMNSASVTPIISLMKDFNDSAIEAVFIWDNKVSWQRANFLCMKTIARTLPRIDVQAR